ncbi:MAG: DUF302 domain-containing protein [Spirochaetaceae bacterium]|nr:DUF302 domain-containing protein [Spirochaetaceae bacterium]
MSKKNIFIGIGLFTAGIVLTAVVGILAMPSLMMLEDKSPYDFDKTIEVFEQSVKDKGWKIPAVHDLQATMKKFDKDVMSVKVYELCHPDHAGLILAANDERIVSSLMPCRVAFYEKEDGSVYMSRMNSGLVAKTFGGLIAEVMAIASADVEVMLEPLLK